MRRTTEENGTGGTPDRPPAGPDRKEGAGGAGRAHRGGVGAAERALAPDLARGMMLLLIVASNTAFHLWAAEHGPSGWHPVDGTLLDRAVQFLMIVMLDLRAYPLFAFLFGYGMMQLLLRQKAHGTPERTAVRLLRRRGLWLIVFGFAHAALLMAGDIIGSYGLAGLLMVWLFIRRGDRTLLVAAGVFTALIWVPAATGLWDIAAHGLGGIPGPGAEPSFTAYAAEQADPLTAAATRITTWGFVTLGGGLLSFGGFAMMLLGFWSARRRVLEEPHRHLPLLRWTAVLGITAGWLGGLPSALAHIGVLEASPGALSDAGPLPALQDATGIFCGLGYVALFALVAHRLSARRRGTASTAVAALGKRSLSGYLTHSLLFSPLLAAWGLGLGASLSSATMALFAFGVWLATVAGAYALERAGRPGPAEALLRRLIYGRPAAAARRPGTGTARPGAAGEAGPARR
ncbi:DUF418 domain-containing protein [Nocardiopsis composta]|uniref:Putative membrane protein YeiB n=1 Tax=Nocardiopsis composta TaxID=157465 RepID=A0A7W8QHZ5_9ACTN|nr:DUF418 domain-containing protein [Nocardiopsis composta]MBB5430065.1 putative membrane protein YeiB [Nocardiopsis composta]